MEHVLKSSITTIWQTNIWSGTLDRYFCIKWNLQTLSSFHGGSVQEFQSSKMGTRHPQLKGRFLQWSPSRWDVWSRAIPGDSCSDHETVGTCEVAPFRTASLILYRMRTGTGIFKGSPWGPPSEATAGGHVWIWDWSSLLRTRDGHRILHFLESWCQAPVVLICKYLPMRMFLTLWASAQRGKL